MESINPEPNTHNHLAKIAEHLAKHGVEFVVIGGWAIDAAYPKLGYVTNDIDLVISDTYENYKKLATALNESNVRVMSRGLIKPDKGPFTAEQLQTSHHWRFSSTNGQFDVTTNVGILSGYDIIAKAARKVPNSHPPIYIADPKIIHVAKRIISRKKDTVILDPLRDAIIEEEGSDASELLDKMYFTAKQALNRGTEEAIAEMETLFAKASTTVPQHKLRTWRERRRTKKQQKRKTKKEARSQSANSNSKRSGGLVVNVEKLKAARDRCGSWMPRARVRCGRPKGHRGKHAR